MIEQGTYWLGALIMSGLAAMLSVLTYVRSGDWKRSEAGKEVEGKLVMLKERIGQVETRTEGGPAALAALGNRMTAVETRLLDMPTKGDIERLSAEVDAVQDSVRRVENGNHRIESFLMEKAK